MKYVLSSDFEKQKARDHLEKLIAAGKPCEITEIRKTRSRRANAYFHAILTIYAMETGYTLEEAKTLIKRQLGLIYEKNGTKFLRSTSTLDSKEMATFTEQFRNLAATQGIYLNSPEEYEQQWAEIDAYISRQREYL